MGNCYPAQPISSLTTTMEINIDSLRLPCMICNEHYSPQQLRSHLDKVHYMLISEKECEINCQCLICGDVSRSTERHNNHLQKCHFSFMDQIRGSSVLKINPQLNSQLKKRVKKIHLNQITNIRRHETDDWEGLICQYLNESYVLVETKQQDVIGLEERYVESNLIWKEIFIRYSKTEYFAVGECNGEKRGYLLMGQLI